MTIRRQYSLAGLQRDLTLKRCRGWRENTHMTGSHCLTAAALPDDLPMEWFDGRLTGKKKNGGGGKTVVA